MCMHKALRAVTLAAFAVAGGVSIASLVLADTTLPSLPTASSIPTFGESVEAVTVSASHDNSQGSDARQNEDSKVQSGHKSGASPGAGMSLIQALAKDVTSSTIVVPNASAPRVLEGDSSTQADGQAVSQSAKLIEQVRNSNPTPATQAPSIPEQIATQISTGTVQSFIQSIVQAVAQAPQSSRPQAGEENSHPATATSTVHIPTATSTGKETNEGTTSQSQNQTVQPAQQIQQLEQIGQNIRAIDTAKRSVEQQVSAIVTKGVDQTVNDAVRQATADAAPGVNASDATERAQKLQQILVNATVQGQQIAAQVSQSVLQGAVSPQQVSPVLDSSLQGIARTVQAQSGVPVSAPTTPVQSRDVEGTIQTATQNIQTNQNALAQRDGLDLYRDTDHDGISDYDEVHIYHTDPNNAYTAGGTLTDGERILLGLDPLSTSSVPVPVENPQTAGVQADALFEVTNIAIVPKPAPAAAAPTPEEVAAQAGTKAPAPAITTAATSSQTIRFSGRALPNSFVTLYVFSTPVVVTVKTDQNGLWTYTLDSSLPDGTHNLYVATVDDGGRILAKSPAIPFVKTAEALDYQPLVIQTVTDPTPFDVIRENLLASAVLLALLFGLVAVVSLGFRRGNSALPQ